MNLYPTSAFAGLVMEGSSIAHLSLTLRRLCLLLLGCSECQSVRIQTFRSYHPNGKGSSIWSMEGLDHLRGIRKLVKKLPPRRYACSIGTEGSRPFGDGA